MPEGELTRVFRTFNVAAPAFAAAAAATGTAASDAETEGDPDDAPE
jgi:hypothetical protein